MVKDKLFVSSAIFAFSIYFLLIVLFFLYVKGYDVKKYDALKNQTVLELELVFDESETKVQKTKIKDLFKEKPEEIEKTTSRAITNTANIKSLFANVKTAKDTKVDNRDVLNVRKSLVSSRYKSKFEKEKKSNSLDVSNILDNVVQKSKKLTVQSTTNNNYDEYYSKIYEILNQRWSPKYKISGLKTVVLISIRKSGAFNYKILQRSGNPIFDKNLKSFLDNQTNASYPSHDKKSVVTLQVTFKSEE